MDAPPEREDCRPFLQVAALLHEAGLNAPQIIAQDLARGFLLLSDLGRQTYLNAINAYNDDALMSDAIDEMLSWQLASRPGARQRGVSGTRCAVGVIPVGTRAIQKKT